MILNALLEIKRQKLDHPPLTLFWPIQEEVGLYGARLATLSKFGKPQLCFKVITFISTAAHYVCLNACGTFDNLAKFVLHKITSCVFFEEVLTEVLRNIK